MTSETLGILAKKMSHLATHYYCAGTPEGDLTGNIFEQLFLLFDDQAQSESFREYCEYMGEDL